MFLSWWRGLVQTANPQNLKSKSAKRWRIPRKLRYTARVEQLEDRVVPAGTTNAFLNAGPSLTNIAAARSATVPVFIDAGTLSGGAGGIQSGTFYVKYDPAVLAIDETTDIKLGSLLSVFPSGTYAVSSAAGFGSGTVGVGITHATSTFYTGTAGGHLVELDFHVLQTIPVGQSTLLDLVPSIPGHQTVLADQSGAKYTLTPAPTTYAGTLTQAGALTPATLNPADTDPADATIQVIAKTPAVTPTAVNDSYAMAPNNGSFASTMTVTGLANGVLANDTDASGPMNAVLVGGSIITVGTATSNGVSTTTYTQNTAHGSVTLNAVDGSFSYTPAANFTGSDSFTYQAVDAFSNTASATATVTIQVGGFESIPQNLTLDAGNPSNTVTVPVNIANPDPANSGGLVTAIIAINYDKSKFTVTGATIGSVLKNAGWTSFVSNFSTPGRVNISTSGPAITSTKGGDLADITFKPVAGITNGTSVVNLAGTGTELDVAGTGTPLVLPFAVAPVDNPTTIPGPLDGLITVTGGAQVTTTTTTVSTSNATPVYGTAVTLTATVAPASGEIIPTQGSVSFYINGNTLLGAGISAGADASHDALFTYVTAATQLKVAGGPQPVLAVYTAGAGFSSSTSTNTVTETVSPAPLTVTGITANNKVYDATTKATLNTGSAALAGVIPGDTLTLSTAGATGTFASKNVGNGITVAVTGLTVSGAQAANYTLTQPTTTANITPATLTVTGVTANNKVYDGTKAATLNTAGATLVGVIAGDTVTLNAAGATGTFASKDVGNNITVTAAGLGLSGPQGGNYTLTQPTTTANITPATLTVTGITAKDKVYDTTTAATLNTAGAALAGLFAGDTVTLNTAAAKGVFASKDAGTGITVTVTGLTISGAQAGDYTLSQPTLTANITPAPLTANITAKDKAYDATTKATLNTGSASLSGVLGSDLVSLNSSNAKGTFASKDVGNGITVTVTGLTLSGAQAADYMITPTTTTANITPASLTVSGIKAADKVYDSTTKATIDTTGATLVGVFAGDTVTLNTSGATGAFLTRAVGTGKTVVVSGLTLAGPQASDYTITSATATANITQATLTVTGITAKDKKYDGTTAASFNTSSAVLTGVISGDTVTVTGATGTFASKDVGSGIAVTVTAVTLGGAQGGNYKVTPPTTALTANITPAALTVTGITANNKVYDGTKAATLNTGSAALAGVVAGDTVTLNKTGATGTFASKDVGNGITVTVSGLTISGAQAGDYTLTQPTTTANITPATLTVTGITAKDKVYDSTTKATLNTAGAALVGVVAGDTVTLNTAGATGTFTSKDVGHGITVTVTGLTVSGAQAADYTLTQPTLTANITPATLTVTGITAKDKVYDSTTKATLNTAGAALVGVFAGDNVTLNNAATGTFASKDVGNGITVTVTGLTLSGAQAGDYTLTLPGPLTANITPATLTVTGITAKNKVYDSTKTATLNTAGATLVGVFAGDNVTLNNAATGTFASKDVGNGITVTVTGLTLSGAQAGDYTLTLPGPLTANITPATLTVTGITANNKVYDTTKTATLNTAGAALAGVFAGDTVTLSTAGATGTFASKDVGNGIAVTVSGITISGAQAFDYTLTQPTLTANITPAPLTVTGITAQDKVFDGTTNATLNTAAATLVGVFAGDTVTLNTAGATGTFATKAIGNNITVQVSGLTLSGPQALDYTLTQPTTTANITPDLLLNQLTVAQGTPTPLTSHLLRVDRGSPPDTVVFTIVTAPAGTLMDGATKLTAGSTFTQADINAGKVTFTGSAIGNDSFTFSATDGQGGTVPTSTLHITVVKNFTEPPVTIADRSLLEGLSGLTPFTFQVKLPLIGSTANGPVTYDVFTTDGTAKAGVDYVGIYPGITGPNSSGTVTFAQGSSIANVTVYVIAGSFSPTKGTPSKTFSVSVSNPNNPNSALATATGTIIGQAPKSSTLSTLAITGTSVMLGQGGLTPMNFQVSLSVASVQDVTYDVYTTDGTAHAFVNYVGITAGANSPNAMGTVTFRRGTTHAVVTVYAIDGSLTMADGNKTFTVSLSDPLHPGVALASATGTIIPSNLQVAVGTPTGAPGGVVLVSMTQLYPVIMAAELRWQQIGVPVSSFQGVKFAITDLGNHQLGNTYGKTINIDSGAAGFGWFVDPAPRTDWAFQPTASSTILAARAGSPAVGHMDLLTVVEHELGHLLNLPDQISGPSNLMTQGLPAGTRRLPDKSLLAINATPPITRLTPVTASQVGPNTAGEGTALPQTNNNNDLPPNLDAPVQNNGSDLSQPDKDTVINPLALDQFFAQAASNNPFGVPVQAVNQLFATLGSDSTRN